MFIQQYREVLINNAMLLIGMKGYRAMTIQELLSLSQVTKQHFDELYESKNDLLKAVLLKYAVNHFQIMEDMLSSQQSEDERILAYFQIWRTGDRLAIHHDASLIVMLATEIAELDNENIRIYQDIIDTIIFRLSAVISDGKKAGTIISMLDANVIAREVVNMWLGAAIMDGIAGSARERNSTLKIMRTLLYSQFY